MIAWQLTRSTTGESLVVALPDGRARTVPGNHPTFDRLLTHLRSPDPDPATVHDLLDVAGVAARELRQLSERVSYLDGVIHFDGNPLDNALSRHLVRLIRSGDRSYPSLVRFMENLSANPSGRSRTQLFTWLADRDMTITPDGHFVGYKGVRDDDANGSIHAGRASVNDVEHTGHIPNLPGAVVQMPRQQVSDDRHEGCASGLHVGTWQYASTFGRRVLIVAVNPRDVVSVPKDCDHQKLRTCRYTVLDVIRAPLTTPSYLTV